MELTKDNIVAFLKGNPRASKIKTVNTIVIDGQLRSEKILISVYLSAHILYIILHPDLTYADCVNIIENIEDLATQKVIMAYVFEQIKRQIMAWPAFYNQGLTPELQAYFAGKCKPLGTEFNFFE